MFTSASLLNGELPDIRIGIGCSGNGTHVEKSVRMMDDENIIIYRDPRKMVDDLMSGEIGAAVRGDMSSSKVLPIIKSDFKVDQLERLVLLEPRMSKLIFMAPVGIDEGWTVESRYDMAVRSVKLMERLGAGRKIGVMSGGRVDDTGRNPNVDRTLRDAEELVKRLKSEGTTRITLRFLSRMPWTKPI